MSKRVLVVVFLVAALAAAAWFWSGRATFDGRPDEQTTDDSLIPSESATDTAANNQVHTPHVANGASATSPLNFDRVAGVSEIERMSRQAGASRAMTLDYLQTALAYCESADWRAKHPSKLESAGQLTAEAKQALNYTKKFAQKFCDSPSMSVDAINAEFTSMEPTDDVVQSQFLDSLSEEEAKTVGVDAARRLLLDANSASTMARAGQYLLGQGQALPQTKELPIPAGLDPTAVQLLALDMLSCDVRGGCGSNGVYTAMGCGMRCRPGVTMADVWKDQNSPEALRYARALASAISGDRAAAAKK